MNKNRISLISILIVCSFLIIHGCKDANIEKGYLIKGKIHEILDGTKVILYDVEQAINIDSTTTKNGTFIMSGVIDHPTKCRINVDSEYAQFWLENTTIEFESPIKNMRSESKVIGGYEQDLSEKLQLILDPVRKKYEPISDSLLNENYADLEHRENLIARHRKLMDNRRDLIEEFSLLNANSYNSLYYLYFYRKRIGKETLSITLQNLKKEYQNTRDAVYFKKIC